MFTVQKFMHFKREERMGCGAEHPNSCALFSPQQMCAARFCPHAVFTLLIPRTERWIIDGTIQNRVVA